MKDFKAWHMVLVEKLQQSQTKEEKQKVLAEYREYLQEIETEFRLGNIPLSLEYLFELGQLTNHLLDPFRIARLGIQFFSAQEITSCQFYLDHMEELTILDTERKALLKAWLAEVTPESEPKNLLILPDPIKRNKPKL